MTKQSQAKYNTLTIEGTNEGLKIKMTVSLDRKETNAFLMPFDLPRLLF